MRQRLPFVSFWMLSVDPGEGGSQSTDFGRLIFVGQLKEVDGPRMRLSAAQTLINSRKLALATA